MIVLSSHKEGQHLFPGTYSIDNENFSIGTVYPPHWLQFVTSFARGELGRHPATDQVVGTGPVFAKWASICQRETWYQKKQLCTMINDSRASISEFDFCNTWPKAETDFSVVCLLLWIGQAAEWTWLSQDSLPQVLFIHSWQMVRLTQWWPHRRPIRAWRACAAKIATILVV